MLARKSLGCAYRLSELASMQTGTLFISRTFPLPVQVPRVPYRAQKKNRIVPKQLIRLVRCLSVVVMVVGRWACRLLG